MQKKLSASLAKAISLEKFAIQSDSKNEEHGGA